MRNYREYRKVIEGEVFFKLTVIKQVESCKKYGQRMVLCLCECKKEKVLPFCQLLINRLKSCGCSKHQAKYKNSVLNKRMYRIWGNMKTRCYCQVSPSYKRYGARGIRVCENWLSSFDNFYEDMKDGYADNLSLDRIDVNGNYCKENCKWSDRKTQSMNRRNTIYVIFNNEIVKFFDIKKDLEKLGYTWGTIKTRMHRGFSFEESLKQSQKILKESEVILICKLLNKGNGYTEIKKEIPTLTNWCFNAIKKRETFKNISDKYLNKKYE